MTEAEWLAATDLETMLPVLGAERSYRKSRHFAVACCLRISDLMTRAGDDALVAASRYADGEIEAEELYRASQAVGFPNPENRHIAAAAARAASSLPGYGIYRFSNAAGMAVNAARYHVEPREADRVRDAERAHQADLLRDIFGNPFRSVAFDPAWLTPTVVGLATVIYDDWAFDRMPILADALEEAGCDNADVLLHCRGDGPHVRGCWVVDAVLGKE